jgi:uncharacterized Zn finger protein
MTDICPICNEGFLKEHFKKEDEILIEYCTCSYCGTILESAAQIERNQKRKLQGKKYYGNE